MKTKIIPFDLEMAKKIQAGEIEGKIKTRDGKHEIRIVCFDSTAKYRCKIQPIIAQDIDDCNYICAYFEDGAYMIFEDKDDRDLTLEVPEEAPKQLTLDDCQVGDKVWVKHKDNYILVKIKDKNPNGFIYVSNLMSSNYEELYFSENTKVYKQKPEFKPFDKVLVRNGENQAWRCDIFSHKSLYNKEEFRCIGNVWAQCIPYEGNEHLVGTTDNSK